MDDVIWAALIAALAALAGSGGTYFVTNRAVIAQATEAEKNRTNDRTIHAHDRAFERRADACVGVARCISWMQDYVIYWNQQAVLTDPKNADRLVRLPIPGTDESALETAPTPPDSWSDVMRGLARLYLDEPAQERMRELLVSFTQYQSLNATLHYSMANGTGLGIPRDNLVKQMQDRGTEVQNYGAQLIALLKVELDKHTEG